MNKWFFLILYIFLQVSCTKNSETVNVKSLKDEVIIKKLSVSDIQISENNPKEGTTDQLIKFSVANISSNNGKISITSSGVGTTYQSSSCLSNSEQILNAGNSCQYSLVFNGDSPSGWYPISLSVKDISSSSVIASNTIFYYHTSTNSSQEMNSPTAPSSICKTGYHYEGRSCKPDLKPLSTTQKNDLKALNGYQIWNPTNKTYDPIIQACIEGYQLDNNVCIQNLITVYNPIYSDWTVCSSASPCTGIGEQSRTLTTCQKIVNDVYQNDEDLSFCNDFNNDFYTKNTCMSPAGTMNTIISGGTLSYECLTGESYTNITPTILCNEGFVANIITKTCEEQIIIPKAKLGENLSRFNNEVKGIVQLKNNQLIAFGSFTQYNGSSTKYIVKMLEDYTYDSNFITGSSFNNIPNVIVEQPDGKILVGGNFTTYNNITSNYLIRLLPNGLIDSSFNIGIGFDNTVSIIKLQPDGKILVGGNFTTYQGTPSRMIIRLNENGSIDSSFQSPPLYNPNSSYIVQTIDIQPDGKILVGGKFQMQQTAPFYYTFNNIGRLNINGSLDTTFNEYAYNTTGITCNNINKIMVLLDGNILFSGVGCVSGTGVSTSKVTKLNSLGLGISSSVYDYPQINCGSNNICTIKDFIVDSLGHIYTVYNSSDASPTRLIKNMPNGALDLSFQHLYFGTIFNNVGLTLNNISILSNGNLIISGLFDKITDSNLIPYEQRKNVIEVLPTGMPKEQSLNIRNGFLGSVYDIAIDTNESLYVVGSYSHYNNVPKNGVIKLIQPQLDIDETFITPIIQNKNPAINNVSSIDSFVNNQVIIGGPDFNFDKLVKFNFDGSYDTTFSYLSRPFGGAVNKVLIQPNQQILLGGNFNQFNFGYLNRFARLNADGTPDNIFNTNLGSAFNATVKAIALQDDGKIIVGGDFTSFNGISQNKLTRLNTNGTIDASFNIGTGFNGSVNQIAISNDGKIIVGGDFTSFNGISQNKLIRLNTNGTIDASFDIGTGFNGAIHAIAIDNQSIYLGGEFTSFNNISQNRIIRLNANGTIDPNFNVGNGFNSTVRVIKNKNSYIFVGGDFMLYNKLGYDSIIKLSPIGTPLN